MFRGISRGPSPHGMARTILLLLFACFFSAAFASQRFFHALFLAGLQIKGMTFYFFDDVFLLYLPLETAQCILERFTLLNSDFSQTNYTPLLVLDWTSIVMSSPTHLSQAECQKIAQRFRSQIATIVALVEVQTLGSAA